MQKPSCPLRAGTASLFSDYCFFSVVSVVLVEPLAALLLGVVVLGAALLDEEVAPPAELSVLGASLVDELDAEEDGGVAGVVEELVDEELSLFFDASTLIDVEPEPAGAGVVDEDDEVEPDGAAGVVVDEEDDAEPDGGVVVVVLRETARSPSLSQPVRMAPPSASETATAKVVSLITKSSVVGVANIRSKV